MEEDDDSKPKVIIDNGAASLKVGLSSSDNPTIVPNLIGRPKSETGEISSAPDDYLIGNQALEKKDLELEYTIENGVVKNWDVMQKIWEHCFKTELQVDPKENVVMITERHHNKKVREKMAQILFESFEVPGIFMSDTAVLSLYSLGSYTGLVVDSGECTTEIAPFSDGSSFNYSRQLIGVDGRLLTTYLRENLGGGTLANTVDFQQVKELKELFCTVAMDFEEEIKFVDKMEYELPDGKQIFLEKEKLICGELMFYPCYYQKTYSDYGIGEGCYKSIMDVAIDLRKELYQNIVLSGGNTMFNGLPERLECEVQKLAPDSIKPIIRVLSNPDRQNMPWNGASALSFLSKFKSILITKKEYNDSGASIIEKKTI